MMHSTTNLEEGGTEQAKALESVRLELAELQTRYKKDLYRDELEMGELRSQNDVLKMQIDLLRKDLDGKALHEYASMIKDAAPGRGSGSAYVVQIQSTLCKALHQVGVYGSQVEFLEESSNTLVKSTQAELCRMRDATADAEHDAAKKMVEAEREVFEAKAECSKKLDAQAQTIDNLKKELEAERRKAAQSARAASQAADESAKLRIRNEQLQARVAKLQMINVKEGAAWPDGMQVGGVLKQIGESWNTRRNEIAEMQGKKISAVSKKREANARTA